MPSKPNTEHSLNTGAKAFLSILLHHSQALVSLPLQKRGKNVWGGGEKWVETREERRCCTHSMQEPASM